MRAPFLPFSLRVAAALAAAFAIVAVARAAGAEPPEGEILPNPAPSSSASAVAPNGPKRVFGVIPNHRAADSQDAYVPLTRAQKFEIARRDSLDWPNYLLTAGFAIQTQVSNHGFRGAAYGREFGSYYTRAVADQFIGCYLSEALLPSLLHEDPRFFRRGTGSVWRRALYASSRIVITRTDRGTSRFNFSEIAGNSAIVAVTTAYYPANRSAAGAGRRLALQLGNDVISNLMTEFWPDLKRGLRSLRRH